MKKSDLILEIIDRIDSLEDSCDYDEEFFDEAGNYLRGLHTKAKLEELPKYYINEDERKFYIDIISNALKNKENVVKIPYFDTTLDIGDYGYEYFVKIYYMPYNNVKSGLYLSEDTDIIEDYIVLNEFMSLEDMADAIVNMILFDKYC